jgi:heat-inducible transcriptional repressor
MSTTPPQIELTERQRTLLTRVVEEYVATGQPVGSKTLVERLELGFAPSTVRNELADLERLGLLTHPHTSAGRIPTERGYRYYADRLLDRLDPRPASFPLDLTALRSEVEAALQATTEMLSQATHLLALVSAPPLEAATIRHVEVLLLQPTVVVVVAISSTGGVTKRVFAFEQPIDRGLANWASQYLNEQLVGVTLGTRLLHQRLADPSLTPGERVFIEALRPAFTELVAQEEQRLFVGGAAGMLDELRADELARYRGLLELLERRRALLDVLAQAFDPRRPFVRVGDELAHPALRELALVGTAYGLANRTLGAVSLIGPVRMDYEKALRSVRGAASELSRFAEDVFGEN